MPGTQSGVCQVLRSNCLFSISSQITWNHLKHYKPNWTIVSASSPTSYSFQKPLFHPWCPSPLQVLLIWLPTYLLNHLFHSFVSLWSKQLGPLWSFHTDYVWSPSSPKSLANTSNREDQCARGSGGPFSHVKKFWNFILRIMGKAWRVSRREIWQVRFEFYPVAPFQPSLRLQAPLLWSITPGPLALSLLLSHTCFTLQLNKQSKTHKCKP